MFIITISSCLCNGRCCSDKEVDLTFDEFLDMVDENPEMIVEFSTWLTKELNKDSMLSPSEEESEEDKKKVKKS